MFNPVFKLSALAVGLVVLTACGRVSATGAPTPEMGTTEGPRQEAPGARPTGAQTLLEAETRARAYLGTRRNANLAALTVGPVTAEGQFTNAIHAGWMLGFWTPGKDQLSYQEVTLPAWHGEGQLRTAFGAAEAAPAPLVVGKLLPVEQAIASALAAGLPEGDDYELDYLATPAGAVTRVTSRKATRAIAVARLDRSGKALGKVEKPE